MKTKILKLEDSCHLNDCILGYGHFNTIHPGHIRYLRYGYEQGAPLVIAIKGNSIVREELRFPFSQEERAEALSLLGVASAIILLKGNELDKVIEKLRPRILLLGNEFKISQEDIIIKAISLQNKQGGLVKFHAGEVNYLGSELLSFSESELSEKRRLDFLKVCKRQNLTLDILLKSMESWKSTRLIVLGDTIVDQYSACEPVGLSAEAPVVVVRELEKKNFLGGAAIVASHIKALGAECDLVSVVGKDKNADFVQRKLQESGIGNELIVDTSRPTTFKKRYLVENQKLFRVSRLDDHNLDIDVENKLIKALERLAPKCQGIVISDFVYGVITDNVLSTLHELSSKYNLLLFGDVQCSSQVGFISRLKNFSLLCPNEKEARVAIQEHDISLEQLSRSLIRLTSTKRLIMKLGGEGFIAYEQDNSGKMYREHFPALSANPMDVTGAGDSLLAILSIGLASKEEMMVSAALGCCIASLAVNRIGNSPVLYNDLRKRIIELLWN